MQIPLISRIVCLFVKTRNALRGSLACTEEFHRLQQVPQLPDCTSVRRGAMCGDSTPLIKPNQHQGGDNWTTRALPGHSAVLRGLLAGIRSTAGMDLTLRACAGDIYFSLTRHLTCGIPCVPWCFHHGLEFWHLPRLDRLASNGLAFSHSESRLRRLGH